jgi:hypothetical protein
MRGFFSPVHRFLTSHAGKATVYVVVADTLITMPDLLGFVVAGYLLFRGCGELRLAFRRLDARPAVTLRAEPEACVKLEPAPAFDAAVMLERATPSQSDAAGDHFPAIIVTEEPLSLTGRRQGGLLRRA